MSRAGIHAADADKSVRLPVAGFDGIYAVTNDGRVWSCQRGLWLKPRRQNSGYLFVSLYGSGDRSFKNFTVHRLVACAFVPNPRGLRCVNHLDGDKDNNRAENLEWVSHSENMRHAVEHSLWVVPPGARARMKLQGLANRGLPFETAARIRELYRSGRYRQNELAEQFGVDFRLVNRIVRGKAYVEAA